MYRIIFLSLSLLLSFVPVLRAEEDTITPYGDYCKEYTTYGTCKDVLPPGEALKALDKYYGDKGYSVGAVRHRGRFIEAEIYRNGKPVDKVLFDRKTGRLRSIY